VFDQISITGSAGGSLRELRDTLEFATRHNVRPLVESYPTSQANEALQRLVCLMCVRREC
jgi:D-arabinose 1-dehydrogenase-like Zn-dependent alcohol dehydrogenase